MVATCFGDKNFRAKFVLTRREETSMEDTPFENPEKFDLGGEWIFNLIWKISVYFCILKFLWYFCNHCASSYFVYC